MNKNLNQLYNLLDKAEKLSGQFEGGYSDHFFSAEDFHSALIDSITKLKSGDTNQISNLYLWFSPSYDWDNFTNTEGESIGNEIFGLLTNFKRA